MLDNDGLFGGQPLCLVTLNHPSLVITCIPSFTLPVPPSSVPGPSQSIMLSTVSSAFHPFKSHQVRRAVDFSCALHSTQLTSISTLSYSLLVPAYAPWKMSSPNVFGVLLCLHSICSPNVF